MSGFAAYWWIIFVTDGLMGLACGECGLLTKKKKAFFSNQSDEGGKGGSFFSRLGSIEFSEEAFRRWGI